jgi:S-adenosylmethionine decarboxylase
MADLHTGRHVFVDAFASPEVCSDDGAMLELMAGAARAAGATVIGQMRYHFGHNSPPGFAAVVMLDESHISCHAYADTGQLAMDFFTCGDADPRVAWEYMRTRLDLAAHEVRTEGRFAAGIPA